MTNMESDLIQAIQSGTPVNLKAALRNLELRAVALALTLSGNSPLAAAQRLGMKRTTLQMKLKSFERKPLRVRAKLK